MNGSLSVAQRDFRFDIVIHHLDHFQLGACKSVIHARDAILSVLGSSKAHQANHLARADDLQRCLGRSYPRVVV